MTRVPHDVLAHNARIGTIMAAVSLFLILVPCCVVPLAVSNPYFGILSLLLLGLMVGALALNWPWLHTRFPHWRWLGVVGLFVLAGVVSVGRGYVSDLPPTRPADFAIRLHNESVFGQYVATFDASTTTCQLSGASRDHPFHTTPCTVTPAELDAVYQVLREQRFDQIHYYAIPRFVCFDQGGDFYIQVTANGRTYYKENPRVMCAEPFTGVAQWEAAEQVIRNLSQSKTGGAP